ncbi:MAG: hypothetical protein JOZ04_14095 [Acidimicrobiia bacterium]|nr:hypothetical protein [Acidimicrobiia bacterium]
MRIGLKVNPAYNPAPQFVPPKVLPPVAEVPACVSPLHANAIDYAPAPASDPTAVLATTGGTVAVGVALALLAAALILRETFESVRSNE